MGYGARALEALGQFYSGDLLNLDEAMEEATTDAFADSKKADKVRDVTLKAHLYSYSRVRDDLSFR